MAEGKQLLVDYTWNAHDELKQLLENCIPYCLRNITPETGQHVIVEPYNYYAIRFRCTDDLEVNRSIFERAVAICAKDEKKGLVYSRKQNNC